MSVIKNIIVIIAIFTCPPVGFILAWIFNGFDNDNSVWGNVAAVNREAEKDVKDYIRNLPKTKPSGKVGSGSGSSYYDGGVRAAERALMNDRGFL